MRYPNHIAAALTAVLLGITPLAGVAAQGCTCPDRNAAANGRIAGALGGGLFAGLIAAVLGMKHASEAAAQPMVGPMANAAAGAAPMVTASTGSLGLPADPSDSAATGDTPAAAAPIPADPRTPGGQRSIGGPAHNVAHMRPMSARDAREEGLIPAKTASLLPAFAMMGAGALVMGLLLLREKSRGTRGVRRRRR